MSQDSATSRPSGGSVAVIVSDGMVPFSVSVFDEVYNDNCPPGYEQPEYDYTVCTDTPGRLWTAGGFDAVVEAGLEATQTADLVAVASKRAYTRPSEAVSEALRAAHERGATILASCTAVFTLGHAGLLDERRCTTHWRHGEQLQAMFPRALVDTNVLYVDEGNVVTGAGSAGAIDANLYLVRKRLGAQVAAAEARRIVVAPHRDGGQAQFIRTPITEVEAESLGPVLEWARHHLNRPLSVAELATKATMTERTFARRFREETGTSPLKWLISQRVALAAELLETSDLAIELVAERCGFGSAAILRHHFVQSHGIAPQAHRRAFAEI